MRRILRALRAPVARAHTPAALRAHARPLSALRVPAFLNDARIELYEDSILLRAVSSLTPLGNGRILVKPYDPALTQRIRETLNDALATTGLKAFWDARAANLVVVPKAYRTDSKAARAKQARAVTLDADLEGDANLDALEMLARAKEAPLSSTSAGGPPRRRAAAEHPGELQRQLPPAPPRCRAAQARRDETPAKGAGGGGGDPARRAGPGRHRAHQRRQRPGAARGLPAERGPEAAALATQSRKIWI